ncbi:MAG: proline dehydrogenase family protein [Lunatimonas sp.]|uniref:proline dehydrogenase family protein n=1 Tax=Lunatimonas sp. TaxID=2060141 RepID=UPI00263B58F2|nr:proline dehydrogenase family protein [Lunatimonas sp.]MCC5937518.1 proline dehydrogenase family protein [Lunatimonas sp.]
MEPKPNVSFENTSVAFAHRSDATLKKMRLLFKLMHYPFWLHMGIKLANGGLKWGLPIQGLIKSTVFEQFCGGEDIASCRPRIQELASYGVGTILDYSVEGKKELSSFEATKAQILQTIREGSGNPHLPFAVFKVSGIANVDVLTKVQAGEVLDQAETEALQRAEKRIGEIFAAAAEAGVRIMVDGEESWFQDVIDRWVLSAMATYNRETAIVYNTFQLYRHDMLRRLKDAHHDAVAKGYFLGAKLVRGAYMEKERERAKEKGYPSPIQPDKEATDRDYDRALQFCINNKQRIFLVSGTHNELSNQVLSELVDLHGMKRNDPRVYAAQLYGMSDAISFNLAKAGYNTAKYLPYGPVAEVLPYLSRRVEENSGMAGQRSREYKQIKQELARRKKARSSFPTIGKN